MGGTCTTSTPSPCNGFYDGVGSFDIYVGMGNVQNQGNIEGCACDVACHPCYDTFPGGYSSWRGGKRWMRPSRTLYNQDSRGMLRPALSSLEYPHRIPHTTIFDRAPCYDHTGRECYDTLRGLCECDNPPNCNAEGPQNPEDPGPFNFCPSGQPCPGLFYDTWWYDGYLWSPHPLGGFIKCRLTTQVDPLPIEAKAGSLYQAAFLRSGSRFYYGDYNNKHCVSNKFVFCAAYIDSNTQCTSSFSNPQLQETYNAGAAQGQFHNMGLSWNGISLKDQEQYSNCTGIVRDIKNAALARIPQLFDTVQHKTYSLGVSGNVWLDIWERQWSASGCDGFVLAEFPDSYLRFSRCPVRVTVEMVKAKVSFSLVAHTEGKQTWGENDEYFLLPTVRVRVHATLAVRAYLDGNTCILNGQTIEIDNHNEDESDCPNSATVVGGIDEIIVVHDGKSFDPPTSVEWWGYHGRSGVAPWLNRLQWPDFGNQFQQCCRLGWALSGLAIKGWPTAIESRGQSQANSLYDGSVTIDFANQGTFTAVCGQPDDGGGAGTPVDGDFKPNGPTGQQGPFSPSGPKERPYIPEQPDAPFDPTRPPIGRGPNRPIGGPDGPDAPEYPAPRGPVGPAGPYTPADREPPREFPPNQNPFDPTRPPVGQPPVVGGPRPRLKPPQIPPTLPIPIGRRPIIQGPGRQMPPNDNPPSPHDPIRGGNFPFGPTGPIGPGPDRSHVKI